MVTRSPRPAVITSPATTGPTPRRNNEHICQWWTILDWGYITLATFWHLQVCLWARGRRGWGRICGILMREAAQRGRSYPWGCGLWWSAETLEECSDSPGVPMLAPFAIDWAPNLGWKRMYVANIKQWYEAVKSSTLNSLIQIRPHLKVVWVLNRVTRSREEFAHLSNKSLYHCLVQLLKLFLFFFVGWILQYFSLVQCPQKIQMI